MALLSLQKVLKEEIFSKLYETAPQGVENHPPYLNLCLTGMTSLTPKEFLNFCQTLEKKLGREKSHLDGPKMPRIIDIDILFWDKRSLEWPDLTVPHPRWQERQFVLVPLMDLTPAQNDQVLFPQIVAANASLPDQGVRELAGERLF